MKRYLMFIGELGLNKKYKMLLSLFFLFFTGYIMLYLPAILQLCVIAVICIICLCLYFSMWHCRYHKSNVAGVVEEKQKLLVIVPHPDDELNVAGVLIRNVLLKQGTVYIIYTTNFDVYGKKTAVRRLKEIKKLCKKLLIPSENIFFMGYQAASHKNGQYINRKQYTSAIGKEKSCAVSLYGKEVLQTFDNLEHLLYEMIIRIKADIICGIDYDSHADHRIASVTLEHVMNKLSKENASYMPFVLKGFSYATSWMSVPDFYDNKQYLNSSVLNNNNSSYTSQYDWEERVRLPYINGDDLGHTLRSSYLYKLYSAYTSQNALSHMNQIINGDQVFWKLSNDNVLSYADVVVSSGKKIDFSSVLSSWNEDFGSDKIETYPGFWKPDMNGKGKNHFITFHLNRDCIIENAAIIFYFESLKENFQFMIKFGKENFKCVITEAPKGFFKYQMKCAGNQVKKGSEIRVTFISDMEGVRVHRIIAARKRISKINYYKIASYPNKDFLYELFFAHGQSFKLCVVNQNNSIVKDNTIKIYFVQDGKEMELYGKNGIYEIPPDKGRGIIVCKKEDKTVDMITIYPNSSLKYFISLILSKCEKILDWYLKRYRSHLYTFHIKKLSKERDRTF